MIKTDLDKNIVYTKLSGLLSETIIINAFDYTVRHKDVNDEMARLWDFTGADLSGLGRTEIINIASHLKRAGIDTINVKVAFVTSGSLDYGLTRMLMAYYRLENVSAFMSIEEAEVWMAS
jgi:uncharacterized hydantoinase/oxoprolinase family protein